MKAIKLKRFFVSLTALVVALIVAVFVAGVRGADGSLSASAVEEKPRFVLSSNPVRLNKSDPYREFTITIRVEGVENYPGGIYGANILLTPADASLLDFVDFIESKDIEQSKLLINDSAYKEGENVVIEAYSSNLISEDFTAGGFTFKLKESVKDIPDSITFNFEDNDSCDSIGDRLYMDGGSFTIEYANEEELEDNNDLSALRLTAGSTTLINGTDIDQHVQNPISYADRGNLRLTADRAGKNSSIKVTYTNTQALIITLVSERVEDLHGQSLGDMPFGERVLEITVTSETGKEKVYKITFTLEAPVAEKLNTLNSLSISVGGKVVLDGTDDEQTVPTVAYADRDKVTVSATRYGAASTVKVVDSSNGNKTLVSERKEHLVNESLEELSVGSHTLLITVTSEAGKSKVYTVSLRVAQENVPQISVTSDIAQLTKSDAHREFTLTVKIEGVDKVQGGLYGANVIITPVDAASLEFVRFVASTDNVQSALGEGDSEYKEGENVVLMADMRSDFITEDFTVGGFTFRLKEGVTELPSSIDFIYSDNGTSDSTGVPLYMAGGVFTLEIASDAIEKPVLSVTENAYSGSVQNFAPAGMAELVAENKVKLYAVSASGEETEVGIDAFSQTNAGSYEIVARPVDGYSWAGASGSAAQTYSFTINKAKINAVSAEEGKLPLFTSDSYKNSLDNVVTYKYYSDAECTQEVSTSDIEAGKSYYLKAVLQDGAEANFAFDDGEVTQVYVSSGFAYTPVAENSGLSTGAIVGIVIGVIAALAIIAVIVFIILKKKKDGNGGSSRGSRGSSSRGSSAGHGSSHGSSGHGSSSHGSAGHGSSHGSAGHGTHHR